MITRATEVEWLLKQALRAISRLPPQMKISYEVTVAAINLQLHEAQVAPVFDPHLLRHQTSTFQENIVYLKPTARKDTMIQPSCGDPSKI